MKLMNFPRRQYVVDRLQYRLLLTSLLYIFAVVLIFAGALFVPLMITLNTEKVYSPTVAEAARQFLALHNRVWAPVSVLVGLLVIHNIVFSHRIAGPLYRIRNELKKIGDGNLFVHVKLRKNDYLDKEAAAVNEMVDALRSKIRSIEHCQKHACTIVSELQRALVQGSSHEMNGQIDELGRVLDRLKESVERFQVPRELTREREATATHASARPAADLVGVGTSNNV